ncbi:MAG: hypothetical protein EAZ19_18125, partial [Oscillatoriales cyanobacterium]
MKHGDFNLAESTAILRYLSNFAKKTYLMDRVNPISVAETENYISYHQQSMRPIARLVYGQVFAPKDQRQFFDAAKDTQLVDTVFSNLLMNHPQITSEFILEQGFSICDIILFCEVIQLNIVGYDLEGKY